MKLDKKIFSERLKELMTEKGETVRSLGEKVALSGATISRYITGDMSPKITTVESFARYFKVNLQWLLGFSCQKYNNKPEDVLNLMPVEDLNRIPIIGSVRCGFGGAAYEENIGYGYANVKNKEEYKFFRVKGDSMAPDIKEGDLALVHIQPDVESGELAIVIFNGDEGALKKVLKQGDSLILQSFNPDYPPKIFSGKELEKICIYGKVVKTEKQW